MENFNKAIGQRIRIIRKQLKLTQKELAKRLPGTISQSLSLYELGDVACPIDVLAAIAREGRRTMDWVTFGYDMPPQFTELSDEETRLIAAYRGSSLDDRKVLLRVAEALCCK